MADTESTDRQGPLVLDAEVAQSTVIDAEVIPNAQVEDLEPQSAAADAVIDIDDDNNNESNEKITDPYDPFVPNDLLEYWEKQAATRQRKKLERETRESLVRQKSIRKKINEERLELQKSGNYSTLIERERERKRM